jgi:hypothetical protein
MYPLIVPTLYKSFAFVVLVSILTVIEETTIGFFTVERLWTPWQNWGRNTQSDDCDDIILLLILIPYFAFRSLGEIIGDGILLYFQRR